MKMVNTHEAKTHLSRLLVEVAGGAEIVIANAGKPIARLVRYKDVGQPAPPAPLYANLAPLPTAHIAEESRSPIKTKVTYWRESTGQYLGFLNDFPDHWTQGEDLADLKMHLQDLFELFSHEEIPGIRKEEVLQFT